MRALLRFFPLLFLIPTAALLVLAPRQTPPKLNAAAVPGAKTLRFYEGFEPGTDPMAYGWSKVNQGGTPAWMVTNTGALGESSNAFGGATDRSSIEKPGSLLVAGNSGWKDYTYSVRMKGTDDDAIGLVFRYNVSNGAHYRFSMDRERGYRRLVRRNADGTYTKLWEDLTFTPVPAGTTTEPANPAYKKGVWYTIQANAIGTKDISVWVNPKKDGSAEQVAAAPESELDTNLNAGIVGVYSWGMQNAFFDDVTVDATITTGFSIAALPDTQYYTTGDGVTPSSNTFLTQTAWLAKHRGPNKLAFVVHEGDIVSEACRASDWTVARAATNVLRGRLPYAVAPGNHDIINYFPTQCGVWPNPDSPEAHFRRVDKASITSAFPVDDRTNSDGTVTKGYRSNFPDTVKRVSPERAVPLPGEAPATDPSNSYHEFDAQGIKFGVIALQFGPTPDMVQWALSIANSHKDRHLILVTHDYVGTTGALRGDGDKAVAGTCQIPEQCSEVANQLNGAEIFRDLVHPASNIQFVLNGHVATCGDNEPAKTPDGETTPQGCDNNRGMVGHSEQFNSAGRPVYQMLANYQGLFGTGGGGYLRILNFIPSATGYGSTVKVKTVRPNATAAGEPIVEMRPCNPGNCPNSFELAGVDLSPWSPF